MIRAFDGLSSDITQIRPQLKVFFEGLEDPF
jgi:hypothetical protein